MVAGSLIGIILAYMIQIFYCWRVSVREYDELLTITYGDVDTISVAHSYYIPVFIVSATQLSCLAYQLQLVLCTCAAALTFSMSMMCLNMSTT